MARIEIASTFLGCHTSDGVTRTYFPVAKLIGTWPHSLTPDVFRQVEHIVAPDNSHVTFDVRDVYHVIDRLKNQGVVLVDQPPFSLWEKIVHYIDETQEVDEPELIERIGAEFWSRLHAFQRVGVQQMVRMGQCFNMDEMGTGKTIQSIAYCAYFRAHWPAVVLCPSSLRYTWQKELHQWLPGVKVLVPKSSKQLRGYFTRPQPFDFLILSYGLLKTLHELPFRAEILVCDESHYLKSVKSKRSVLAANIAASAKYRLLLSGSPFSYTHELYAQLRILDQRIFPHFFNFHPKPDPARTYFVHRYCQPIQKKFGAHRTQWEYKGFERSTELNALLNCLTVRRRKKEVLSQLPEKHRTCIYLPPLGEKDQRELKELLQQPRKETTTTNMTTNTNTTKKR
jgi:SWI/SNF-related matrix-associated actin-dependent regulator 1 of chromatin subfamily A